MDLTDLTITTSDGTRLVGLSQTAPATRARTTITGASTLTVDLLAEQIDQNLSGATIARAAARDWALVSIRNEGGTLRLVYEDAIIHKLRGHRDRIMWQVALPAADIITRFTTEAGITATVDADAGQTYIEGAGRSILTPTDSWQEIATIAARIGTRAYSTGTRLDVTTDRAALAADPVHVVEGGSDLVPGEVQFAIDTAQPSERAKLVVADAWAADAGQVVELVGAGPANGRWIVAEWSRSIPASGSSHVRLTRPLTIGV